MTSRYSFEALTALKEKATLLAPEQRDRFVALGVFQDVAAPPPAPRPAHEVAASWRSGPHLHPQKEVAALVPSANAFTARRGAQEDSPSKRAVLRFQGLINRLTDSNYDAILASILALDQDVLATVVDKVSESLYGTATMSKAYQVEYARLLRSLYDASPKGFGSLLRNHILQACQGQFERCIAHNAEEEDPVDDPERIRAFANMNFVCYLCTERVISYRLVLRNILPTLMMGGILGLELFCAMVDTIGSWLDSECHEALNTCLAQAAVAGSQTKCRRAQYKVQNLVERWGSGHPPHSCPPAVAAPTVAPQREMIGPKERDLTNEDVKQVTFVPRSPSRSHSCSRNRMQRSRC